MKILPFVRFFGSTIPSAIATEKIIVTIFWCIGVAELRSSGRVNEVEVWPGIAFRESSRPHSSVGFLGVGPITEYLLVHLVAGRSGALREIWIGDSGN